MQITQTEILFIKNLYKNIRDVSIITTRCLDAVNDYYTGSNSYKLSEILKFNNLNFVESKEKRNSNNTISFDELNAKFLQLEENVKKCQTINTIKLELRTLLLNTDISQITKITDIFYDEIMTLTSTIGTLDKKWDKVLNDVYIISDFFIPKDVYKDLLKIKVVLMYINDVNEFLNEFWAKNILKDTENDFSENNQDPKIVLNASNDLPIFVFFLGKLNLYQKIELNTTKTSLDHYTYWAKYFNKKYQLDYFKMNQKVGTISTNNHSLNSLLDKELPENEKIIEVLKRVKQQLLIEYPNEKKAINEEIAKYLPELT